jgi:putative restriction endonuclease
MLNGVPLIYFFGVTKGHYMPVWPVYVVHDDPGSLTFSVAVDEKQTTRRDVAALPDRVAEARRPYVTRLTVHRLHQATFRDRVLRAYRNQCAICRLRHIELLDAAHILPDTDPRGEPVVPNGLALCKLHHAAYDRHVLGVRPDLVVEVRRDILEEEDGPMLRYGLQETAGVKLLVPASASQRPRADFLEERYRLFRDAS